MTGVQTCALPICHGPQLAAQRLLGDGEAELLPEPLDQIDQAPAHHAVDRRHRPTLDDGHQGLALAEIYDGGSRTKAAQVGGVGLQTLRDWVVRFNARGPDGLIDGKAPGNTCKLNDSQRQAVAEMVENGPTPAIHGVVRWRLKDLTLWIWEEFQISLSETTLSRELRALGYRKLSARPRHHHCCEAWNKLIERPWTIMSIGLRDWANGF